MAEWASELTHVSGISVREGARVCCAHFRPHSTEPGHRFTKGNFPGIKLQESTPMFTRTSKRKREAGEDHSDVRGYVQEGTLEGIPIAFVRQYVVPSPCLSCVFCPVFLKILVSFVYRYISRSKNQVLRLLYSAQQEIRTLRLDSPPPFSLQEEHPSNFALRFDPFDSSDTVIWCGIERIDDLLEIILQYGPPLKKKRGPSPRMSQREVLVLTLVWLWTGLPLSKLLSATPFKDEHSLRDLISTYICDPLSKFADLMVSFPTVFQWDMMRGNLDLPDRTNLRFNIDGTPIETWASSDPIVATENFNHKHQMPSLSFWVLVGMNGRILYTSEINMGNKHDATAWNESGIIQLLERTYPPPLTLAPPLHSPEYEPGLNADKAYPKIDLPNGFHLYVTKTAAPDMPQADMHRHMDASVARHRSVVERSIRQIKKWRVLENLAFVSSTDPIYLQTIIKCIAALVNWRCFTEQGLTSI